MKKIFLLTGQLRFTEKEYLDNFLKMMKDKDVLISTTKEFEELALNITKKENIVYLDDYLQKNYQETKLTHIYQWMHLDLIINTFKKKMLEYDVIYRIRTDITFDMNELLNFPVDNETIYLHRDILFFAETKHFIKTFENYYDDIFNIYINNTDNYVPLNYNSIIRLENINLIYRWHWLIFPKIIWSKNFEQLKKNIKNYIFVQKMDIEKLEMNINVKLRRLFTSEKSFIINALKHGLIKGIPLKVNLLKDRFMYKKKINLLS